MKKCNFCGALKTSSPKLILIELPNGPSICKPCLGKATLLLTDEEYDNEKVINIQSPLTNSVA